jgi:leader peptidase (prepilin peptidase) / N-methyltransferase
LLEAEIRPRAEPYSPARVVAFGIAAAASAVWVARYGIAIEAVVAAAFFATLAFISAVDIETRRIPNAVVLPATAVTFLIVALLQIDELTTAALAAGGAFLIFFVPSLISPRLIGMGDAKLALLIGAMLGDDVLSALLAAAFSVGFFALLYVAVAGRRALKASIPFGPFLAGGAVVALVAGGGTLYS